MYYGSKELPYDSCRLVPSQLAEADCRPMSLEIQSAMEVIDIVFQKGTLWRASFYGVL